MVGKNKGKTFDISVHVPFVVRAPFLIRASGVSAAITDFTDLFPTFAEVAGAKLSDGLKLDGHSLVPVLSGESQGKREWIHSQLGKSRVIRDATHKLNSDGGLFDLREDPLEKHDLRDTTAPDVVAVRKRLSEVLNHLPEDASAPFDEYRGTQRKKNRK